MKRARYRRILLIFAISIAFAVIGSRYIGLQGRGDILPPQTHSWEDILNNLPRLIIVCLIFSLLIDFMIEQEKKITANKKGTSLKRLDDIVNYSSPPHTHECRVCGYFSTEYPWGEDGKSPTYEICPCCGVQFGKEDVTLESIQKYRAEWLRKGTKWFAKKEKPEHWQLEEQMKQIPERFK